VRFCWRGKYLPKVHCFPWGFVSHESFHCAFAASRRRWRQTATRID
jgi:hypothetical protein